MPHCYWITKNGNRQEIMVKSLTGMPEAWKLAALELISIHTAQIGGDLVRSPPVTHRYSHRHLLWPPAVLMGRYHFPVFPTTSHIPTSYVLASAILIYDMTPDIHYNRSSSITVQEFLWWFSLYNSFDVKFSVGLTHYITSFLAACPKLV